MKSVISTFLILLGQISFAAPLDGHVLTMTCQYEYRDISGKVSRSYESRYSPGSMTHQFGNLKAWASFNFDRIIGAQIENIKNHTLISHISQDIEKMSSRTIINVEELSTGEALTQECYIETKKL